MDIEQFKNEGWNYVDGRLRRDLPSGMRVELEEKAIRSWSAIVTWQFQFPQSEPVYMPSPDCPSEDEAKEAAWRIVQQLEEEAEKREEDSPDTTQQTFDF